MRILRSSAARRAWLVVLGALHEVGCASSEQAGFDAITVIDEGVINDPANKSLRFDLLQFGLTRFCFEMQQRGIGLKMRDDRPIAGRFFASTCQSQILEEGQRKSLAVRFGGKGYGWTNLSSRVGFETDGFVEYAPDFQIQGESMYIYFRPQNLDATAFRTTLIESAAAQTTMAVVGVQPDQLGQTLVKSQLQRGFTVIRSNRRGEIDFGMGLIPLGQRPFRPFQVVKSARRTLENDRAEVYAGQQDYLGGFTVEEGGQALTLTMTLDGAPQVDVLLLNQVSGTAALGLYTTQPGPTLPQSVAFSGILSSGKQFQQTIAVPAGTYFVLLDHSAAAGTSAPDAGGQAARIDYLIQVGDRP